MLTKILSSALGLNQRSNLQLRDLLPSTVDVRLSWSRYKSTLVGHVFVFM